MMRPVVLAVPFAALLSLALAAQQPAAPPMQHTPGMQHAAAAGAATQGGQAAFAAISEIVKILEADKTTDWSKVNIEALRQHLIDMDTVTLRARVAPRNVPEGLSMDVTGDAPVAAAINRMLVPHAAMLDGMPAWRATATPIDAGVRLTVTARTAADAATIAKIRGLGFAGLLVQGDHHTVHHLQMARGTGVHGS
jgi:hypothetical protein